MAGRKVYPVHQGKGGAPSGQFLSLLIQKTEPQRFHGAHAAVAGGRTADTQEDFAGAVFHGPCYHLSGTHGGCEEGIPFFLGNQHEPRSLCHFHNSPVSGKPSVGSLHRFSPRTGDCENCLFPCGAVKHRFHRPFAAVCHGKYFYGGAGKTDRAPSLMTVPASREERVPLKESAAMMICIMAPFVIRPLRGPG